MLPGNEKPIDDLISTLSMGTVLQSADIYRFIIGAVFQRVVLVGKDNELQQCFLYPMMMMMI